MANRSDSRSGPVPHATIVPIVFFESCMERVTLMYRATAAELIAAGAATPELLGPWKRGKTRVDADGDRALITRRKDGIELQLCRKAVDRARCCPGVSEELLATERARFETIYGIADQRNEARYRAEELVITSLRRMPTTGFVSTVEALGFLADLRDVVQLADTRRGARGELAACLADQISLSQTVRLLNNLPTYDEAVANRPERAARQLRLVVDNTRH